MIVYCKVEGLDELRKRLEAIPKELQSQQRAAMHRAVILVRDEARGRIHSRDGKARSGIRATERGAGAALQGVVEARSKAAIFSQRSRGAGKKMPPPRRIFRWLERIGKSPTPASAFLVARAIAKRGTMGHPVMVPALEAKKAQVAAIFFESLKRAIRRQ